MYMGYTDNYEMEKLLAPIIKEIENDITDKDVLEIACGTGNWTQVLSRRARSVVACDLYKGYILEAKKKDYEMDNVIFKLADAYTLNGIKGDFSAAFAGDWFSHIPKSKITGFLKTLHGKLLPESRIVIIDMLKTPEFDKMFSHKDYEGNEIQIRTLPNGRKYQVIKNFFKEEELLEYLSGYTTNINYFEDPKLLRWILTYTII
jgi:demethylmenaquinone methyltransferase/2-methoxy-6-polyprenyl-1,4-benzoquinol methylase